MSKKIIKMILIELAIISVVLIIYVFIKTNLINFIPECIINKHFHILCPSCGGTRCIINLLSGNFTQSFKYHQIFFITIVYLMIVNIIFIINSFKKKEIATFLYPKTKFWIIFIVVILAFTIIRNIKI